MQWLARVAVSRPVFTWVMSLVLLVLGVASVGSLPVDRFPNIDVPYVTVVVPYPGASPAQVETEVTEIIEEAVGSVSGLSELRSTSYEGLAVVAVQFELEKDGDVAAQEVRDRVNRVLSQLPEGVEPPRIEKLDPDAQPIYYVALRGPGTAQELTQFADDELKGPLEGLAGVGSVQILGGREREIGVALDPARLQALGLSITDVAVALRRENLELPGGDVVNGGETRQVRVPGRVGTAAELADLPVMQRGGQVIYLRDVATVTDGAAEAESLVTLDGENIVMLTVTRQSGTNAIAVADRLAERIDEIRARLPAGYQADVVRDESTFSRTSVDAVKEHLLLGAIFAVLVVFSFLRNGRATVIAALAIPVSIIATFAVLSALGLTLNMITLLALTLAVGIVIDDAIVVIENVIRFLEERKLAPREATLEATKEIGLAVMATTLSLVAVFLPVVFMGGIVGRFLSSFGITMSVAVLVSLFVAFSLTPMLSSKWLKRSGKHHGTRPHPVGEALPMSGPEERARYRQFLRGESGFQLEDGFLERWYGKLLAFSMGHRWVVGIVMIVALAGIPVIGARVPTGFLPTDDEGRFEITVEAPQGTSLAETEIIAERLARQVRSLPEVEHTVLMVGSAEGDISGRGSHEALIYVGLVDQTERDRSELEVEEHIRAEYLPSFVEREQSKAEISRISGFGGSGPQSAPIQYLLRGPEFASLERFSDSLAEALGHEQGVSQADTTFREGRPELRVEIDRPRAAELGVTVSAIADALRILVGGADVTNIAVAGDQYDVNLRAGEEFRRSAADLDRYEVRALDGRLVPLSQVARVVEGVGPAAIEHVGRERSVMVYATTLPGASTAKLIQTLNRTAAELNMPPGYSTALTGQAREFGKAARGFLIAIVLSFVFMYLIIAAQFESWVYPLSILASLPLTVPFALFSVLIFGQSLNVYSMLGLLVLFGIVKKNSILQVDHTLTLMREGFSRPDAVMLANRDRLRPILMTTIAFVAGMVPLLLSKGAGSGTNHAIAGIVLGGQTLALLLTLVGTPVIFTWLDDLARRGSRVAAWVRARLGSDDEGVDGDEAPHAA
ncbi:MAG: efflux RND transporter permease subunit [Polyangiales bacterium]|nr:efflux RND transporter permease subunit [Myxococcales bacterium]MCB9657457.1 efflux RND transporter permease subunit [Sandaracinaceae bacterium]